MYLWYRFGSCFRTRDEELCIIEYALISPFPFHPPHALRYGLWSPVNGARQSRVQAESSSTIAIETHHDDMILGHFDLPVFLLQLHLCGPVGGSFMSVVMFVRYFAEDHEVQLVVAVRVDLDGAVVPAGDV